MTPEEPTSNAFDRVVMVLHEPQDLVNTALVIRGMKNMGLSRLRLVSPAEWDPWRVAGVAHDTRDVIDQVEILDDLGSALHDRHRVIGTTARRRSTRQDWWNPEEAARFIASGEEQVALVFGREDRGLSNEALDLCHSLISIPVNPDHSSMNLAHAALIIMYELRKAVVGPVDWEARDLSFKKRRMTPSATHGEIEEFFAIWRKAMDEVGLFHGIDPVPKMRSFRSIFKRAAMDRRELGLVRATAFEIIHFVEREMKKVKREGS